MNRQCLLSRAYDGVPMTFNGKPIYYSPLVNEVLRETKNGFFYGNDNSDQTEFLGVCEAFLIMSLYADGNFAEVRRLREIGQAERNKAVLDFALENEAEIERAKPDFVARIKSAMAATVEGTMPGKHP